MAWAPPVNWADGTVYDQADFDAQISGNLGFLYDPPSCLTYNNQQQNLTSGSVVNVTMQEEAWDTDGMHSAGAQPYRHEYNTAGVFIMYGGVLMNPYSAGWRGVQLDRSGSYQVTVEDRAVNDGANWSAQVHHTDLVTTSDTTALQAYQTSGLVLGIYSTCAFLLSHWCGN